MKQAERVQLTANLFAPNSELIRRNRERIRRNRELQERGGERVSSLHPLSAHRIHTSRNRRADPFPSLLGKGQREDAVYGSGWGVARCFGPGRIARRRREPSSDPACFPHRIRPSATFPLRGEGEPATRGARDAAARPRRGRRPQRRHRRPQPAVVAAVERPQALQGADDGQAAGHGAQDLPVDRPAAARARDHRGHPRSRLFGARRSRRA